MNRLTQFSILSIAVVGVCSFRAVLVQPKIASSSQIVVLDTTRIDPESGMINDPSLMLVKAQCTACHSSKLILQHRFTRAGWLDRIRWMQKYHKLWDLGESEKVVLDYLETYYGPDSAVKNTIFRRAPMKPVQWYRLE